MFTAIIPKTRKYLRIFRKLSSTNIDSAIVPGEHGIGYTFVFKRMVAKGIFVQTGNKKFYLDEIKAKQAKQERRKFLLILFVSIILCCGILFLINKFFYA